jgi:hypothetical protein
MSVTKTIFMGFMSSRRILANKFAKHLNDSVLETLAHRREITRICALFEAYNGEPACNCLGDTLEGTYYLSRDDHDSNIKDRKQRKSIGKYSSVNRTIKLWNRLLVEALTSFPLNLIVL